MANQNHLRSTNLVCEGLSYCSIDEGLQSSNRSFENLHCLAPVDRRVEPLDTVAQQECRHNVRLSNDHSPTSAKKAETKE